MKTSLKLHKEARKTNLLGVPIWIITILKLKANVTLSRGHFVADKISQFLDFHAKLEKF